MLGSSNPAPKQGKGGALWDFSPVLAGPYIWTVQGGSPQWENEGVPVFWGHMFWFLASHSGAADKTTQEV